jgi:DNA polymerase III epsilon subunit family exonuclease
MKMFGRRKTSIEYVVIDTETTGFHAESRIIELAMVVVSSEGKITEDFSTFLHGDGTVGHPMAARVHGIKTHQVASAPTFKEIFRTYSEFIDGRIPVAHNASFDRARINYELKLIRKKQLETMACTLSLGVELGYGKLKLGEAARQFGIETGQAHRALDDARATAHLLRYYMKKNRGATNEYLQQFL